MNGWMDDGERDRQIYRRSMEQTSQFVHANVSYIPTN